MVKEFWRKAASQTADFYGQQYNVTPTSLQEDHCMRLPQCRCRRYWFSCCETGAALTPDAFQRAVQSLLLLWTVLQGWDLIRTCGFATCCQTDGTSNLWTKWWRLLLPIILFSSFPFFIVMAQVLTLSRLFSKATVTGQSSRSREENVTKAKVVGTTSSESVF